MAMSRNVPELNLVVVKFDDNIYLVPVAPNGYIISEKMAEKTDLSDPCKENKLREILQSKSVREIKSIIDTFGASIAGNPNKASLIENFVRQLPALMANVENNLIPEMEAFVDEQEEQREQRVQSDQEEETDLPQHAKGKGKGKGAPVPFTGKAHRLGEDKEEVKDEAPTAKDYVKIIVKGKHLETHVMLEMLKWDTIFQVKEKVWRLKNSSKGKVRTLGEEEIFAAVACSNMENKEGVLLENDMTLGEVIGHGKEWGEVIMVVNPRTGIVSNRTDLEMQFIAGGQLQHDITEGEIVDGMEINVRPRKGYKGIIHIIVRDIKMKYHMNEQDTVKQLEDAMTNVLGHDCSPDGLYRLKHLESASLLQQWEPLFATLGADGRVELCVCLLGGGIKVKSIVATKEAKTKRMNEAKDQFMKLSGKVNAEIVKQMDMLKKAELAIGNFMKACETDPKTAIESRVKMLEQSALVSIAETLDAKNLSTDFKIAKVSSYIFELSEIQKTKDTFEGVISSSTMALLYAFKKLGIDQSALPILKDIVSKEQYHKTSVASASASDQMET